MILPESWQQQQTAKLRQMFPDWEIWCVFKAVLQTSAEQRFTWHARPRGTSRSVCDGDTPNQLASNIQRYVDNARKVVLRLCLHMNGACTDTTPYRLPGNGQQAI